MNATAPGTVVLVGLNDIAELAAAVAACRNEYPRHKLALMLFNPDKIAWTRTALPDVTIIPVTLRPTGIPTLGRLARQLRVLAPAALVLVRAQYYSSPLPLLLQRIAGSPPLRYFHSSSGFLSPGRMRHLTRITTRGPWQRLQTRLYASYITMLRLLVEPLFRLRRRDYRTLPLARGQIRRILLIEADMIGDLVLALPMLTALRESFPDAEIDLLVGPWTEPLVRHHPLPARIFIYAAPRFSALVTYARHRQSWLARLAVRLALFRRRYDIVFDPRGDANNLLLAWWTGAPHRVSYVIRSETTLATGDAIRLATLVPAYPWGTHRERHQVEHNLAIVTAAGGIHGDGLPRLYWHPDTDRLVDRWLAGRGLRPRAGIIIVHPGASRAEKVWPAERFAAVINAITRIFPATFIITGSAGEQALARQIADSCRQAPLIAAGEFDLPGFACLLSRANLVLTEETAANPLAAAVGTPVAILMTGVPALYGPWLVPHRIFRRPLPCWSPWVEHCLCLREYPACLDAITAEEVIAGLTGFIRELQQAHHFPAGEHPDAG